MAATLILHFKLKKSLDFKSEQKILVSKERSKSLIFKKYECEKYQCFLVKIQC